MKCSFDILFENLMNLAKLMYIKNGLNDDVIYLTRIIDSMNNELQKTIKKGEYYE